MDVEDFAVWWCVIGVIAVVGTDPQTGTATLRFKLSYDVHE